MHPNDSHANLLLKQLQQKVKNEYQVSKKPQINAQFYSYIFPDSNTGRTHAQTLFTAIRTCKNTFAASHYKLEIKSIILLKFDTFNLFSLDFSIIWCHFCNI